MMKGNRCRVIIILSTICVAAHAFAAGESEVDRSIPNAHDVSSEPQLAAQLALDESRNTGSDVDIRSFINGYFSSWSDQQFAIYQACFLPQAVVQFVNAEGQLSTYSLKGFIAGQQQAHDRAITPMTEVPLQTVIERDSDIARVLVRWRLTQGERVQTGTDYFLLFRRDTEWRIAHLLFTND